MIDRLPSDTWILTFKNPTDERELTGNLLHEHRQFTWPP